MPPPRPEAYPIPTQTYTREYFTFPASKSQDRAAPPPPHSQWPAYEEEPQVRVDSSHPSAAMQVRSGGGFHAHSTPSRAKRNHLWDTPFSVRQPC